MFRPVEGALDLPALENSVLDFWAKEKIFEKSLEKNKNGKPYVFFEGPPTANGRPGIHHVLARSFKDVYNRYKTMRGYHVGRKGGWDTHGLPVEREVEKTLGILNKEEIEKKVGIAEFNRLCRESVYKYVDDWNKLTVRMGFWLDLDDPYFTLSNGYIESVWWLLKQLWDKNLIFQAYKVVPFDPQVGATMSSAEVSLGYKEVDDPSVYVRMRIPGREKTSFLVWTTTPWTLPSNVALAVHPTETYAEVQAGDETLIMARSLVEKVFGEEPHQVVKTFPGKELEGTRYERLFDFLPMEGDGARVIPETFVTMEDGSGIVHIAPAYGADDLAARERHGLPILFGVGLDGKFIENTPWTGTFFKDADPLVLRDLKQRGLLFRSTTYRHSYPFGWRTDCPLIYYAKPAWYIRTTEYKDRLIANNEKINWIPGSIKHGRFGDWLSNNVDWALSRERFWGTPLPIWTDGEGEYLCVGSVAELEQLSGKKLGDVDLHRPVVDDLEFDHPRTGKRMKRVPEVIDCWFDSGAMPYAQWHYPFENKEVFEKNFPADFISEAIDQTRGWFYTLHAIATMISGEPSYLNCVCLGHVVDAKGEKMSKSKGNVVNPWDAFDAQGADAVRWYFMAGSPPGSPKRFSSELVGDSAHGMFNTLWNTYAFFIMYANLDRPELKEAPPADTLEPIDRWMLSRLATTLDECTAAMDRYDVQDSARRIETLVDDLSNWYVRLNRRRFWKGEDDRSKRAAYYTLYVSLRDILKLMAPVSPFFSESLYQALVRPVEGGAASVHLADWPVADRGIVDQALLDEIGAAMRAIGLGRSARLKAGLKVRQPLATAVVIAADAKVRERIQKQDPLIRDELNVKEVKVLESSDELVSYGLRPNLKRLGPKIGKQIGALKAKLAAIDADQVVKIVRGGGKYTLDVEGTAVELEEADLLIDSKPKEGYHSAEEGGMVVSLDSRLSRELILEGLARDLIRLVQDARKKGGLEVSDKIHLGLKAPGELGEAIRTHRDAISKEVLATKLDDGPPSPSYKESIAVGDTTVELTLTRT